MSVDATANQIFGSNYTLPETGYVKKITAYLYTPVYQTRMKAAIYADSNGNPGALLAQSSEVLSPGGGWYWYNFSVSASLSPGVYWMVVWGDNNIYYMYDPGSAMVDKSNTYGSFLDPFGMPCNILRRELSIFAAYTPS